jgi:hypothetical protein
MAITEQAFEKATRDAFLAHGHNLAIHQSRGERPWTVAVDGGFDADGWQCSNADKATAMKKALKQYGYIQEVAAKLQAQG